MFKNYLAIALRNLLRQKIYSLINISGLATGMVCCILIVLYVQDELSYERHHEQADRIYRVLRKTHLKGTQPSFSSGLLGPVGPALQNEFPEVQNAARLYPRTTWIRHNDRKFPRAQILADASILEMFTFPLLRGNPETAFKTPYSILITQQTARMYFGDEDPIGKILTVEDKNLGGDYTITGVLHDLPPQSHLHFDVLTVTVPANATSSGVWMREIWEDWRLTSNHRPVRAYLLLPEEYDPALLERKLPGFVSRTLGDEVGTHTTYHLQPITRIHLYSSLDYGFGSSGDIAYVYLFSLIAFFILLIACVNFMNLATAQSANRAKEVGLRKVVGAYRLQLIRQFLGESVLLTFLALLVSIALVELILPAFGAFAGKQLSLSTRTNAPLLLSLPVVALCVGILAGSYPAFFLSRFPPVEVLKGALKAGARRTWLRKGLVVFQFTISIFLIVSTLIVYNQLDYLRTKKMGFDRDLFVTLPIFRRDYALIDRYRTIKQAFLQHPNVLKATASLSLIGIWGGHQNFRPEGAMDEKWRMLNLDVDEDFLKTYDIRLVAGKNLTGPLTADASLAFILNQTAVKQLGWKDPVGKQLNWDGVRGIVKGTVIGVVQDFHPESLREKIGPVLLQYKQQNFRYLSLKIRPENISETLAFIETTWKHFLSGYPFEFDFLDDRLNNMYKSEMKFGQLFQIFSLLAISVACLGLFGLAAFTTQRRTREIGIRKVLGASVSDVVLLLSREFLNLVLLANLIAWPVAYYMMHNWLQNFAYRITPGIGVFLLGGILAFVIALLTVSYQSVTAALANPVDALKQE